MLCGRKGWKKVESRSWAPVGSARSLEPGKQAPKPSQPMLSLRKGDMVRHSAFGTGMVLTIQPMGGDALIEVAFDNVGTKRMMLKAASQFMSKL